MNSEENKIVRYLFSNNAAIFGMAVICIAVVVAILGANIRPDDSKDANRQIISLVRLKPFTSVKFLVINDAPAEKTSFFNKFLFGGESSTPTYIPIDSMYLQNDHVVYYPYSKTPVADKEKFRRTISLIKLLNIDADSTAVDASSYRFFKKRQLVVSYGKEELAKKISKENRDTEVFLLGTDTFGRDLLSRIMGGTIVSLSVGVIAVFISLVLGILMGGLAGYYRGWVDNVIMWVVNVIWSVPTLLMVIAITVALGKGFTQVFIAVGFTMWVEVARIVRGQFIQLREKDFIMAARLLGFSDLRIILRHMLPNAIGPLIVISAGNFSTAILLESGLSFLGVGTQVPMPSWGGIIKAHFNYITTDYAYLALIPGFCLSLLTLAFMLIGNALRDALDVRSVQV